MAGCRAASDLLQLPCLQQNVHDGGPKACEINHIPSCSWGEADAPAIKKHASQKILHQAGVWAHAEPKVGTGWKINSSSPVSLQNHPSTAALTHQLGSHWVGTKQLVSLGLCRSQAVQCAASRPSFLGLPPSRASLQQRAGGGCLGVWGYTQQWGLKGVFLAGRYQAFPSLQKFRDLESHWGCPKSHMLLLSATSEKANECFLPGKNTAWQGSLRSPEWTGSDSLLDFGVKP